MKKEKPNKREGGITLISLIIMVIILVILSAVAIRAITGEGRIIETSVGATEEYNILQYRERIETLRESIIMEYEMIGKEINLEKLAKEMDKETTWVKSATANIDTTITNEDIIIKTTDGYVFQIYYDEINGQKFIEYIGRNDEKDFPTVIATYDKIKSKIQVSAKAEDTGIEKLDLIYKGEVIKSISEANTEFEVKGTGWYIIKVTSKTGKLRYAWVRVAGTLLAPKIEVDTEKSGKQEKGWYGADNKAVEIKITAEGEKAQKIHYTIDKWKNDTYVEKEEGNNKIETRIKINKLGTTIIYAYTVDKDGNESEMSRLEIDYDNLPPEINEIEIEGKSRREWMENRRCNNIAKKRKR